MITNPVRLPDKFEFLADGRLQVSVTLDVDGKSDTRPFIVDPQQDPDAQVEAQIKAANAKESERAAIIATLTSGPKALDITPDVAEEAVEP